MGFFRDWAREIRLKKCRARRKTVNVLIIPTGVPEIGQILKRGDRQAADSSSSHVSSSGILGSGEG